MPSMWQITTILTLSLFLQEFSLCLAIFVRIFELKNFVKINFDKLHLFFSLINYQANDYNKNFVLMVLIIYVFRFFKMELMMTYFLFELLRLVSHEKFCLFLTNDGRVGLTFIKDLYLNLIFQYF